MYVIVKYAGDYWDLYWDEDPKIAGVSSLSSAHDTYSGRAADLQPSYTDLEEAQKDCARINAQNPCGYYAICKVV